MRKYLCVGNKEVHLGLIIALTALLLLTIVYALTSYVFHQTLTVPGRAIKIYQSGGTTLIPNDSTITSLWMWNSTSNRYELRIVIKNTGTEDVTITFSHNAPSGWNVTYSGPTTIVAGGSINVFITASAETGSQATFDITIAAS